MKREESQNQCALLMKREESQNQCALFKWIDLNLSRYPGLEMAYAIPNGGKRDKITAAILKREGVRPGVLDINIDTARYGFHGLRVELKTEKGRLSKNQVEWIDRFARENYMAVVCVGWEAARDTIIDYLTEK